MKDKRVRCCRVCNAAARFTCSPCSVAFYCCKAHQRRHWTTAHKAECRQEETRCVDDKDARNKMNGTTLRHVMTSRRTDNPKEQREMLLAKRIILDCHQMVDQLTENGFLVIDKFLNEVIATKMAGELSTVCDKNALVPGGGGLLKRGLASGPVRSDASSWYDGRDSTMPSTNALLQKTDRLVRVVERQTNRVKVNSRSHAMISCYEGKGERYLKHKESGDAQRVWTVRYYPCCSSTTKDDEATSCRGGQLRLQLGGDQPVDVAPHFNRLVICLSRDVTQEIRPVHHPLTTVTVWYMDRTTDN